MLLYDIVFIRNTFSNSSCTHLVCPSHIAASKGEIPCLSTTWMWLNILLVANEIFAEYVHLLVLPFLSNTLIHHIVHNRQHNVKDIYHLILYLHRVTEIIFVICLLIRYILISISILYTITQLHTIYINLI